MAHPEGLKLPLGQYVIAKVAGTVSDNCEGVLMSVNTDGTYSVSGISEEYRCEAPITIIGDTSTLPELIQFFIAVQRTVLEAQD